ncbi:MAG: hypothetical protein ACI88A_002067 [Paraglaciecola sp.]|jgi:hypothetical protein
MMRIEEISFLHFIIMDFFVNTKITIDAGVKSTHNSFFGVPCRRKCYSFLYQFVNGIEA